jgi:NarL family two-component system sensor histidine kinase LiaS
MLVLGATTSREPFTVEDARLMTEFAEQATIALQNALAYERVREQLAIRQEMLQQQVARELHDEIVQELVALQFQVARLRRGTAGLISPSDASIELLIRVEQGIVEAVETIRTLITRLYPGGLDEFGLQAALESYIERLARTLRSDGIAIALVVNVEDLTLPPPVERVLFFAAREAISNAVHHAQAHQITVQLDIHHKMDRATATLVVSDDGVGYEIPEPGDILTLAGFPGLLLMTALVEASGGTVGLSSTPGKGTRVEVTVPLTPDARRPARPIHLRKC